MTSSRERDVVGSLVSLAGSMATGQADVVELLSELTDDCARLLDVAAAGLLLADDRGVLHVMAASSEQVAVVQALQLQRAEGPCLDCFRTGHPVSAPALERDVEHWPRFVPAALAAGFASVHAVPMRLSQTADVDMATAFAMLRRYARDHNLRLSDLSHSVVHRETSARAVAEHSARRDARG